MERDLFWVFAGGVAVAVAASLLLSRRTHGREPVGTKIRRGGGNALLTMEEFVAPRVEHVIQARQQATAPRDEDDDADPGISEIQWRADLREGLAQDPIDREELRRHLRLASEAGLDWRELYQEAVAHELATRPYRAPFLPPASRVAPIE